MKRAFLLLLLGLPRIALALDPTRPISGYTADSWDVSDGLPTDSLQAVTATPDGFLWVASSDSRVAWFDGARFETVLTGDWANRMYPRAAGGAWLSLGTPRPADVAWMSDTGELHPLGNAAFPSWGLVEESDGTLWTAGFAGLFRVRGKSIERIFETEVTGLADGRDGALFAGGSGTLFVLRDGAVVSSHGAAEGLPRGRVWAIVELSDGALFLATERGAYRFANGRASPVAGLESQVFDAILDRDGNVWAATDRGLVRWRDGVLSRPPASSPLATAAVGNLVEDPDGALWIATAGEGLWRLSDGPFATLGPEEGLSHANVSAVAADGDGMWIAGLGGIDRVENGVVTKLKTSSALPLQTISDIARDSGGNLWVTFTATVPLVARISHGEVTAIDLGAFLENPFMLATFMVTVDGRGDVWVSSWRGLVQMRDGRPIRRWLPDEGISGLGTLPDGRVWAVTGIDGAKVRLVIATSDGIEEIPGSERIDDVIAESDDLWSGNKRLFDVFGDGDELWVASGHGIELRDAAGWHQLADSPVSLPDERSSAMVSDDDGGLWVATNRGIYRVDRQAIRDVLSGVRRTPVDVRWFGTADGMRSPEVSGGEHAIGRDARGRLWFATARGVAIIDPRNVPERRVAPEVRIRRSRADGDEAILADLPAGTSRIEIDYTASGLRSPSRMRFKYRMEGLDPDWIDAGARRTAYYTSVPPGAYRFQVIAANEDGVWNLEGASIPVRIPPFFWQTRLFVAALIFGLVASGAGVVRLRGRQLRARAADLERQIEEATRLLAARMDERLARTGQVARFGEFAASVAHNLKTPLTFLRGEVELLEEKRRSGSVSDGELKAALEAQLQNIRRMTAEIEAGMSFVRPGAAPVVDVDLADLAREIGLLLRSKAAASSVRIETAFDGPVRLRGNLDNLRHALANLVSNAIEAMPDGGTVTLSGGHNGSTAEIRVSDTGPGIPESVRTKLFQPFVSTKGDQGTGLGLASCRRIVEEEHGGKIRLESAPTTFVLEFPA